jgi:CRISPR-associated endonuclease Cas1
MLNYAYAILESQVRTQIVADGLDPRTGYLHTSTPERQALVLDLMEPQRPLVDRKVLEFVQAHTFHPADFTIRSDGVCRLNPEMVRHVVSVTAQGCQISPTRTVLAGPHRVCGRASAPTPIARHSRF